MFFGRVIGSGLSSLFSTHPPLEERIERLDPSWSAAAATSEPSATHSTASVSGAMGFASEPAGRGLDQIGQITSAHLDYAAKLIASLPDEVSRAAHEPYGARAVIYALLIAHDEETRNVQLETLPKIAEADAWQLALRLHPTIATLDARARLPLVDLALPALCELSTNQFEGFERAVLALVEADQKIELFEWTLQRILLRHLEPHFRRIRLPRVRHKKMTRVADACAVALSVLARVSAHPADVADRELERAKQTLGLRDLHFLEPQQAGLAELDRALDQLVELTPRLKQQLMTACADFISADHEISIAEAEVFRAIADAIDCPVPPLLPGQPLS